MTDYQRTKKILHIARANQMIDDVDKFLFELYCVI